MEIGILIGVLGTLSAELLILVALVVARGCKR